MPTVNQVTMWKGRPIDELSREELLEVVECCGREIRKLQADRDRWRGAINHLRSGQVMPNPGTA